MEKYHRYQLGVLNGRLKLRLTAGDWFLKYVELTVLVRRVGIIPVNTKRDKAEISFGVLLGMRHTTLSNSNELDKNWMLRSGSSQPAHSSALLPLFCPATICLGTCRTCSEAANVREVPPSSWQVRHFLCAYQYTLVYMENRNFLHLLIDRMVSHFLDSTARRLEAWLSRSGPL